MKAFLTAVFIALAGITVHAQTNQPAPCFVNKFKYDKSLIALLPVENWGVYRASEAVTISNRSHSVINYHIRVWRMEYGNKFKKVEDTSGLTLSQTFPPGHYFVACSSDRSQFWVKPNDLVRYSLNNLGVGEVPVAWTPGVQRQLALGAKWRRVGATIFQSAPPYNFYLLTEQADTDPNMNLYLDLATYLPGSMAKMDVPTYTASYTNYVDALLTESRRRGLNVKAVEIFNEPWSQKFPCTGKGWSDCGADYMASIITNTVILVHAVYPGIKVIAPSFWSPITPTTRVGTMDLASRGNALRDVDLLCWHDYDSNDYPPDAVTNLGYDRSNDVQEVHWEQTLAGRDAATPYILSEMGLCADSPLGVPYDDINPVSWSRGMARATKKAILYLAAGNGILSPHCFYLEAHPHSHGNQDSGSMLFGWEWSPDATGDSRRGPQPKTSAFVMACYWCQKFGRATQISLDQSARSVTFNNAKFVWMKEGATITTNLGTRVTDIHGASIKQPMTLTEMPVIVSLP